ncbi:MAG TPA: HD domain-containing protein [Chlamydiales bacterium]|nr:HD domain-containing protein [Chlamydiales bacterium]
MKNKSIILILLFLPLFIFCKNFSTIFGTIEITDPLFLELIESKAMQRLKHIDQTGPTKYIKNMPDYSRFDHSLGVFHLLTLFGAEKEELIAGLLHDTSHTVFSHLGDRIFSHKDQKDSFQDSIHLWHLKQMGVDKILQKYGYDLSVADPHIEDYDCLEKPLPHLCADRIEYNFHSAIIFRLMTEEDIQKIISSLHFENGYWYFSNEKDAKTLADLSLYFTEHFWNSIENDLIYLWSSKAVQRALEIGLISKEEILFSYDEVILQKLFSINDAIINCYLQHCYNIKNYYEIAKDSGNYLLKGKYRGIDPFVQTENGLTFLSDINKEFKKEAERVKKLSEEGQYFEIVYPVMYEFAQAE